jgi:hypothetical protein
MMGSSGCFSGVAILFVKPIYTSIALMGLIFPYSGSRWLSPGVGILEMALRPQVAFRNTLISTCELETQSKMLPEEGRRGGPANQDMTVPCAQPYPQMPGQTTGQTHP